MDKKDIEEKEKAYRTTIYTLCAVVAMMFLSLLTALLYLIPLYA